MKRRARSDKGVPATHGYSITHKKLYKLYYSMRDRCEKPHNDAYPAYGGRGITICPEWQTPEPFCDWAVANGYSSKLTLERIDNSKGYGPDNCTWASRTAQARNRRSNRYLTINGESKTVADWIDIYQIPAGRARNRLSLGWPPERVFTEPPRPGVWNQ